MSIIEIENTDVAIKIAQIGQLTRTGYSVGNTTMTIIPREMVLARNDNTNIFETTGVPTIGFTATGLYVLRADRGVKNLSLSDAQRIFHNVYKVNFAPANVFYVVHDDTVRVMTVLDMRNKTPVMQNHTVLLTPDVREWLAKGITEGLTAESTAPEAVKTEPIKAASEPIKAAVESEIATPEPARDVLTSISMPMLNTTEVYGIKVWTPSGFIKSRTEFRITLTPDHNLRALVVHIGDDGYMIKPLTICPKTNCIKITFRDGVYAVGFADTNGQKCVDPPIENIDLFLPAKQ